MRSSRSRTCGARKMLARCGGNGDALNKSHVASEKWDLGRCTTNSLVALDNVKRLLSGVCTSIDNYLNCQSKCGVEVRRG